MPVDPKPDLKSPCCGAKVKSEELRDDATDQTVRVGICTSCDEPVARTNPKTGVREWLDGEHWGVERELRPVMPEFKVVVGERQLPLRVLVHGETGSGRTTFLAQASKPIFLVLDEAALRHPHVRLVTFPRIDGRPDLGVFLDTLKFVREHQHELDAETLVIESIESIERMLIEDIERGLRRAADDAGEGPRTFSGLNDEQRGGGYDVLCERWRRVLDALGEVNQAMTVMVSSVTTVDDAHGQSGFYQRRKPSIDGKKPQRMLRGWFDSIVHISVDETVQPSSAEGGEIVSAKRAVRFLHFVQQPEIDAKCKGEVPWPERIEFDRTKAYAWFRRMWDLVGQYGTDLPGLLEERLEQVLPSVKGTEKKTANLRASEMKQSFQRELASFNYVGAEAVIAYAVEAGKETTP